MTFELIIVAVVIALVSVVYSVRAITGCIVESKYTYKQTLELLEYFLSRSYDTIYESDIISYVSEGLTHIPPDQRETLERNYVKQTLLFMGINNIRLFTKFFGTQETLVVNIIHYLRRRINEDGLAKMIQTNSAVESGEQTKI